MSSDRRAAGVRIALLADAKDREATPAGLDGRVLGLVYEDAESKADKVQIDLDNRDLQLFAREDLLGGALLEVAWGYRGQMAPPRRVVVQKVTGFEVLTLHAYALSVLMHRVERTRRFEHVRASDVAAVVAREHGFDDAFVEIQPTNRILELVSQAAETDAALVRRLARAEGYVFFVDDTGFHFHKDRTERPPTHTLGWRTRADVAVMSLRVESDVVRRVGRLSVRARDPMTRTTVEAASTSESASRPTLGEGVAVVDPETGALSMEARNASEAVRSGTSADAAQEANTRFVAAERPTVKLSVQTVGDPTLRAKTIVETRGLPALLSGKYYVQEAKHTVNGSGYVCDLKLVRDALGRRAGSTLRSQGGDPNRAEKGGGGELTQVAVIDPETGAGRMEYRREGRSIGGEDPEALMSVGGG